MPPAGHCSAPCALYYEHGPDVANEALITAETGGLSSPLFFSRLTHTSRMTSMVGFSSPRSQLCLFKTRELP